MIAQRIVVLLVVLCVGALNLASANAYDAKAGEEHFRNGTRLIRLEDFEGALAEFETSYELNPTASALFNLANCYKAVHRYGDALRAFHKLQQEFGDSLSKELRRPTEDVIVFLEDLVARLTIDTGAVAATLYVDDYKTAENATSETLILGPGEVTVRVEADGYKPFVKEVKLNSKSSQTLVVHLEKAPEHGGSVTHDLQLKDSISNFRLSPLSWTGIGLTASTGLVSIILWGLTSQTSDEIAVVQPDTAEAVRLDTEWSRRANTALAFSIASGVCLIGTAISVALDVRNRKETRAKQSRSLVFELKGTTARVRF